MSEPVRKSRVTRQLEIPALRSLELADQAAAGQLKFIDAVDAAYEAAQCRSDGRGLGSARLVKLDFLVGMSLGSRRQDGGVQLVLPFNPPLDHQCGRGGPCVLIAEIDEAGNSVQRCLTCECSGAHRRA